MKKQIPVILLAIVCIALAIALVNSRKENARIEKLSAESMAALKNPGVAEPATEIEAPVAAVKAEASVENPPLEESVPAEEEESAGRRMMSSMAKMMENPTMNKVMEASQRGAIGALYADLIEYLGLNAEEQKYFMDLLMYRQMQQMDLGMKMVGGTLSEEEKQKMIEELKEADETTKSEMEKFLNSAEDFEEFEFYEKTMGERMMLSSMDQKLAGTDAALSDETYREVLDMMHEEKKNFDFSSDLHDEKNTDLSPERFSKDNLDSFSADMDKLNQQILAQAQDMLTAEQMKAFEEAIKTTSEMQKAQLEMAAQMFGGGEKPAAP
jgi:hypothetical protein